MSPKFLSICQDFRTEILKFYLESLEKFWASELQGNEGAFAELFYFLLNCIFLLIFYIIIIQDHKKWLLNLMNEFSPLI